VRVGQAQIPDAARRHGNRQSVQPELDADFARHRNVQAHQAHQGCVEVVVAMLADQRPGSQPHQPDRPQGAFESGKRLLEVRRAGEQRRIDIIRVGRRRKNHPCRVGFAGGCAQRQHAPVTLIIVTDVMESPVALGELAEIEGQIRGIE
jgi:hypothetical protein